MPARWNSGGKRVIYTAENRSLACLENLVHRGGEGLNETFQVMVIHIPDHLSVKTIAETDLPRNWNKSVRCAKCRAIGDQWLAEQDTAVLRVPSALVRNEYNYVLNTLHDEFDAIEIVTTEAFEFDTRLRR